MNTPLDCGLCKKPIAISTGYTFGCHTKCVEILVRNACIGK
jgi:hypothetical protein